MNQWLRHKFPKLKVSASNPPEDFSPFFFLPFFFLSLLLFFLLSPPSFSPYFPFFSFFIFPPFFFSSFLLSTCPHLTFFSSLPTNFFFLLSSPFYIPAFVISSIIPSFPFPILLFFSLQKFLPQKWHPWWGKGTLNFSYHPLFSLLFFIPPYFL